MDSTKEKWNLGTQLKQLRSNSWSDSLDDCRAASFGEHNRTLLGDGNKHLYDSIKKSYAEILYSWDHLVARAKILKYLSTSYKMPRGVEFVTECLICNKITKASSCSNCKTFLFSCALCQLPVRGIKVKNSYFEFNLFILCIFFKK